MIKLERLIAKLCPNGVEYKTLGEIGEFVRGSGLQKKDFRENGVGCIHYGQIHTYYGIFADKTKSFVSPQLAKTLKKVQPGDLIIASTSENVEDVCKTVAWLGTDEIVTGGHSTIFKHNQNPKYLAYYFTSQKFFDAKCKYARGTKVIDISAKDLAKIRVPVPPLPIQQEIIRILDKFAQLEAELEIQLSAELAARKKQYEYYRNTLLTFDEKTNIIKTSRPADQQTSRPADQQTSRPADQQTYSTLDDFR
jgi:type I restriction enzyme S subunit